MPALSSVRSYCVGLCPADLYLDDKHPPELITAKEYHTCGICGNVKSHPVSYMICIFFKNITNLAHSGTCVDIATAMLASSCRWSEYGDALTRNV